MREVQRIRIEKKSHKTALFHHASPRNHITVTIWDNNADEIKEKIAAVIRKENRRRKDKITFEIFYISRNNP